ncbi:uncharacterized protein LOC130712363 [Lotus japonicus]|uniref:uncharacterized protein LOC130712363 n=1 Tax=Lotus japonicus TaxID=34305 RepID=UPI0025891449|nr:uncharacterized protein LOC130712363 [Lotus japonicus]
MWRRGLSGREQDQVHALQQMLIPISLQQGTGDKWRWIHEADGVYTVSSAYAYLLDPIADMEELVFKNAWSGIAPSNVSAFVWRVLLDRVQTKVNLQRRNIISGEEAVRCVLCHAAEESTRHLFFSCNRVAPLWNSCYRWIGLVTVLPEDRLTHIMQHDIPFLSQKQNDCWRAVWNSIIWSIWIARNGVLFRDEQFDDASLFELIQVRAWKWLSSKVTGDGLVGFAGIFDGWNNGAA